MNSTKMQITPIFRGKTSSKSNGRMRGGHKVTASPPNQMVSCAFSCAVPPAVLTGKSSSTIGSLNSNISKNEDYWPDIYGKEVASAAANRHSEDNNHKGKHSKKGKERKRAPPHLKSSVRNVVHNEIILCSSCSSDETRDIIDVDDASRRKRETTKLREDHCNREVPELSPKTARRHALQQKKISWGKNEFASNLSLSTTKESTEEKRDGVETDDDDFAKSMDMLRRHQINSSKKQSSTPRALKSSIRTKSSWNIKGSRINSDPEETFTSERMSNIAKHIRKDSRTRYREKQQHSSQSSSPSHFKGQEVYERVESQPSCIFGGASSDEAWISSCKIQV